MSTKVKKPAKKAATGIRYSDAQKKEIVDFVIAYNSTNGRGGQSEASKKFKVTPLTISAWIKSSGKKAAAKPGKKKALPVKTAKAAKPAKAAKKVAKKATKKVAKKVAKSASASKKGKRYTSEQKQEVVDFVNSYNAANGRGGQSRAAKKFKVSVLTVSSWLKGAGVKGVKAGKAVKAAVPAGLAAKVASLVAINQQVSAAEKELEKLYAKQDAVMASFK